ncbi:MAG: zinc ribbon domain-containing protein [Intestinibacter sp.]
MICKKCGNQIKAGAKFCNNCGYESSNMNQDNRQYNSNMNQQDQQQKKKTSKIILGVIVTIAIIVVLAALGSSGDYSEEVSSVKNGYFQDYSAADGYPNVGDAFENYFDDTS